MVVSCRWSWSWSWSCRVDVCGSRFRPAYFLITHGLTDITFCLSYATDGIQIKPLCDLALEMDSLAIWLVRSPTQYRPSRRQCCWTLSVWYHIQEHPQVFVCVETGHVRLKLGSSTEQVRLLSHREAVTLVCLREGRSSVERWKLF